MQEPRVSLTELQEEDLEFLLALWHIPDVMRYADELPAFRGWSKADGVVTAWAKHQEQRSRTGSSYLQLIVKLPDGKRIGESFFAPLPEGFTMDEWEKPRAIVCLMGDIKLLPEYWNQGLGTDAMRGVVKKVFEQTDCELLVVPPHIDNPAAIRVYEKAGFVPFGDKGTRQGHGIMEMSRERYRALYAC
jgi:RimJ/RimL family protein N-acetyltransferase